MLPQGPSASRFCQSRSLFRLGVSVARELGFTWHVCDDQDLAGSRGETILDRQTSHSPLRTRDGEARLAGTCRHSADGEWQSALHNLPVGPTAADHPARSIDRAIVAGCRNRRSVHRMEVRGSVQQRHDEPQECSNRGTYLREAEVALSRLLFRAPDELLAVSQQLCPISKASWLRSICSFSMQLFASSRNESAMPCKIQRRVEVLHDFFRSPACASLYTLCA